MTNEMKNIAAAMGAAALLIAGLIVGTEAPSHTANADSGGGADGTIMPATHSTRPASESYTPWAKAAPPCGFAATGSC
jgi:hypothetical protein